MVGCRGGLSRDADVADAAHLCAVHVVFTRLEGVRVCVFGDNSITDPPVPCSGGVTAAAAGTAIVAARHEVLCVRM